jgi:phosphoglycolate phosphatase-like HAD superfamily hydrolase
VRAARAAGCAAAAVTYGGLREDELRPHAPDYFLPSFASLLGVLAA